VLVLTFGFDTIEYLFSVLKKGKRQHKNVKRRIGHERFIKDHQKNQKGIKK